MFARRRSSLSFEKLSCLNIAFLTYCLFAIGHVTSMSLDRLGRQYQQQNDKQLQLSEFMLPEAESEMLQYDMELAPDLDGHSDMYLIVPAAATNQEHILQSSTELNESQKSSIESNSDMLMLESDDVPAVHILELTDDKLKTKVDAEEPISKDVLDQQTNSHNNEISDNTINNIAGAVLEIENEIETELSGNEGNTKKEKLFEVEMTEKGNEISSESKVESSHGNGEELDLERTNETEENINREVMQQYPNAELEVESITEREKTNEALQMNLDQDEDSQQLQDKESASQPAENIDKPMEIFHEFFHTAEKEKEDTESFKEINNQEQFETTKDEHIKSEALETPIIFQEPKLDDVQVEETEVLPVPADVHQHDKNYAELFNDRESETITGTVLKKTEEINEETPASTVETGEIENAQENLKPLKAEAQNVEEFQPAKDMESIEEYFTAIDAEETQSKVEIPSVEVAPTATSLNNRINEEITPTETSASVEEVQEEQQNEKTVTEIPSNKELQGIEHIQAVTEDQEKLTIKEEHTESVHLNEETFAAQNLQTQHNDDTQIIQDEKEMHSTQSAENTPVDFNIASKPVNIGQTDVLTPEEQHQTEAETPIPSFASSDEVFDKNMQPLQQKPELQEVGFERQESLPSPKEPTALEISTDQTELLLAQSTPPNEDINEAIAAGEIQKPWEAIESESIKETASLAQAAEMQQLPTDGGESLPTEVASLAETNVHNEEPTTEQSNLFLAESTMLNVTPVKDNINENINEPTATATAAAEIQKPLETNENEPIKETVPILSTIPQVLQKENMTHYNEQEEQHAVVEILDLTTLKPFNNLENEPSYSYVNANNSSNNNNIRQEVEKEQQVFSSKLRRYDGAQVWRIVVQNDRERKLADELQTKFGGQLWKEVKQEVDYLLKPQVLADAEQHVRAANLSRIVLIDNLQNVIEVENPPAEKILQLQNRKGYRLTWEAYHRLEDIHGFFDYLAKTYPDICSVETIGYSIEKRPLKILRISNGNADNPAIWIDGGMHAREWISPAVVTYIAHQISEGWDELPTYMRNINWYMHAVANPDGYEYSHTTDRLWRKNMRSHGRACPGVDLNRNFGYKWGGKGTSANPCSQTYRGSKAFSEPETFYISKFISNFPRETFKAYLSFHSYGQYILYPWGYDYHITKDMADLDLLARQAGTIITKSTGAKFIVGSSATTLYPAAGGSDDWAKGIAGIKYSYTIEMGDTGRYGFILPAKYIESNGKNGMTFVQTVAKVITMGKNGRRRKLKLHKTH